MSDSKEEAAARLSLQRVVKVVLAVAIGVTVAWFLVETFLPIPFPHMAY